MIRRARWKTAILLAPFPLLVAVFVFLPFTPEPPVKLIGVLGLPLLLVITLVLTRRLVWPDRLVLTSAGFHVEADKPRRSSRPVRWAEVTDFYLHSNLYGNRAWVGWRRHGSRPTSSALLTQLFPKDLLEGGWTLSPEALVKVLEEWRTRYSTAAP